MGTFWRLWCQEAHMALEVEGTLQGPGRALTSLLFLLFLTTLPRTSALHGGGPAV